MFLNQIMKLFWMYKEMWNEGRRIIKEHYETSITQMILS